MKKYAISLIWVILTFLLLITPKTTLAVWNGLSTAGPDFLSSDDGKTWTYEIGNDGTVYAEGAQVKLAFGAYWCGNSNAAGCDGTNTDYKNVSTLQKFTISAPAAGNATAPATKTFTIPSPYPCGRVQVDIVPDPNPNGDILGGHIYDTGKTCPPAEPTNLSASCSSGTGTLSWTSGAGATQDDLRVDNLANPWSNDCSALNPNDYCFGPPASPGNINNLASGTYAWWVDSCNSGGCSTKHGSNFSCPPPAPTDLSASCPAPGTTATLSWTNSTSATSHNVRLDNQANGWSGSCSSLNSGDFCFDNATSPKSFSSIAGATYGWWVDACIGLNCTTGSGPNFTCQSTFDFSMSNGGDKDTKAGDPQISNSITVAQTGTPQTVTLTKPADSSGITYSFSSSTSVSTTTCTNASCTIPLYLKTSTTAPAGKYTVTVNGTGGGQTRTTSFTLTVQAPASFDFSLSDLNPKTLTQGTSDTQPETVSWLAGVPAQVNLSITGCISGVTCSITPASCTPTSSTPCNHTINMAASSTAATGTSTVTVTGVSGLVTHSKTFALTVTAPLPPGTPSAPTVNTTGLSCIPAGYSGSGVNISWTNSGVTWVDISRASDSSFTAPYYHKSVSGVNSTTGPAGFNATDGSGGLTLNPATDYYVRTFNGTQNSQIAPFNIPACTPACTPETDSAFCTRLGKNCGSVTASDNCGSSRTVSSCGTCSSSQTCGGGGTPNVCGGGGCAWIQTTGGDVHSNTGINTPCGP